jgi:hypothetical protein
VHLAVECLFHVSRICAQSQGEILHCKAEAPEEVRKIHCPNTAFDHKVSRHALRNRSWQFRSHNGAGKETRAFASKRVHLLVGHSLWSEARSCVMMLAARSTISTHACPQSLHVVDRLQELKPERQMLGDRPKIRAKCLTREEPAVHKGRE